MEETHGVVLFVTQAEEAALQRDFGPIIPEVFSGPCLEKTKNNFPDLLYVVKEYIISKAMPNLFYQCSGYIIEQLK